MNHILKYVSDVFRSNGAIIAPSSRDLCSQPLSEMSSPPPEGSGSGSASGSGNGTNGTKKATPSTSISREG